MSDKVDIFINNFNKLTSVQNMLEHIKKLNRVGNIYIVDNCSDYPLLLEWYNTAPCNIIKLPVNLGCEAPWNSGIINNIASQYYIVTDPDLDLSAVPIDAIDVLQEGLDRYPHRFKCSLSLEYLDLPMITDYQHFARATEERFWIKKLDEMYYECESDTIFAIYNKALPCLCFTFATRTERPYTARHLPWYLTKETMTDEDLYYIKTASRVPRFSSTVDRMENLIN